MHKALQISLNKLRGFPAQYEPPYWLKIARVCNQIIKKAKGLNLEPEANVGWHLQSVALARYKMCLAYDAMKNKQYYEAWCNFEIIDTIIRNIVKNKILPDQFYMLALQESINGWQSLFPYRVFASPEIIIREEVCTICNQIVSGMNLCEHRPGYVYMGELCSRKITKADAISIALVANPVQKYSVVLAKPDLLDYTLVKNAVDCAATPFSLTRVVKGTKTHEHEHFTGWAPDETCPCHSGFRYAECCLLREGVTMPHFELQFSDDLGPRHRTLLLRRAPSEGEPLESVELPNDVNRV